jgi:hypothetical protein
VPLPTASCSDRLSSDIVNYLFDIGCTATVAACPSIRVLQYHLPDVLDIL